MTKKELAYLVNEKLDLMYKDAKCGLDYKNIFELIVAVSLSAQTTDISVNKVTPMLFQKYPSAFALAKANLKDVENIIHSLGLYKNKAKNLISLSKELVEKYNGEVPSDLNELQELSGVGYKTASVVLVEGYKIPAFPVDTHISRITKRIGLVKDSLNPTQISISLMKLYDKSLYHKLHHQMIYLGRYTCKSQRPKCDECLIKDFCRYYKSSKV